MNLYLKYCPLAYAIRTRFLEKKVENKDWEITHHLTWKFNINSVFYIYTNYWFWIVPLFVIFFIYNNSFYNLICALLLYLYICVVFLVFYEIWYLYNDLVGIKKEKKKCLHTSENLTESFYNNSIIIRVFFWLILLIPLWFLNYNILIFFSLLLWITQIVFFIHNKIRNYFYNRITLLFLRFLKMSQIFIPIYFMLWTFYSEIYFFIVVVFFIYQYFGHIQLYTDRFWFKVEQFGLPHGLLQHWYQFIAMIMLFLFSQNYIFLIYGCLSFILFIKSVPSHYFKLKNDR